MWHKHIKTLKSAGTIQGALSIVRFYVYISHVYMSCFTPKIIVFRIIIIHNNHFLCILVLLVYKYNKFHVGFAFSHLLATQC